MKPVKFRAWDTVRQRMVEVANECPRSWDLDDANPVVPVDVALTSRSLIPMQYIGQEDRNGVEIFDGDVLANNADAPFRMVVGWGRYEGPDGELMAGYDFAWPDTRNVLVIGNIYANPELVEQQNASV